MKISGTGLITPAGRGWESSALDPDSTHVYLVTTEIMKDKALLKNMRRADRFSKMGVIAAHDALADAGLEVEPGDDSLGIIVTTSLGPHGTTFKFLDDILEYGDSEVSPTKFSHSVHNAAASYIASSLGSRGPTSTVTKFDTPLTDGLKLAKSWLLEHRCKHVLLGYIEEMSPAMEYINGELAARGRRLQSFNFTTDPNEVFSEGAVFLLMSDEESLFPEEISDISTLKKYSGN